MNSRSPPRQIYKALDASTLVDAFDDSPHISFFLDKL